VGLPHQGVLTGAVALPLRGPGFRVLRSKSPIRWGNPRLVSAIQSAARTVAEESPGALLVVGDLSARSGGAQSGHRSHRTGRDADLLLYALTPDGRPVPSPGFLRFGPDGLAETDDHTFVRLDVPRTWLLVKALVESPEASVQWLFLARWLEALVIEHARARGEDPELVWHAETVLLQPRDSLPHDDHLHLRIACTPEEAVAGCEGGPTWDWLSPLPSLGDVPEAEMLEALGSEPSPGTTLARSALGSP
jgi:penicillin-insensitive murein endopeptidase